MLKIRIIPILTFNGFALVKTKQFRNHRMVGSPIQSAKIYNNREVDELIFLDIFASKQQRKINLKIVSDIIKECFMPVGIGGGITSLQDINDLLKIGADKVVIKSTALLNKQFIEESASFFGSQCIAISVDVYKDSQSQYKVYNDFGLDIHMTDFMRDAQNAGAGEFILNSVDNDGMMQGFDIDMVKQAEKTIKIPLVVVGGGGNLEHYKALFSETNCTAVGSASIFHFTQYTPLDIKKTLKSIGKPVRV